MISRERQNRPARRYGYVIALLLLPLLIPLNVSAQERIINSLPYTVSTADNGYTLRLGSSNLTCPDRAITFSSGVHDVVLDLGTDTITWGTAGNTGTMGVFLAGSPVYNITIRGGYILHDPPASATVPSNLLGVQTIRMGGGNHDILIDGVYFRVAGRNSKIMYNESGGNPGTYNVEITNCRFESHMESFTSREMWMDAAMVALGNNNYKDGPGFQYHYRIHNNTTINAHWCNLYLHGTDLVAEVYDNYLMADARNDLGTGFPTSAAQCYPLAFRGGGGTSRVDCYNNTIRSGTSYGGCRGIFISGIDGEGLEPHNSVYIHDNDIVVHQGFDGEERTLNGILVRQGWSNVYLRNNSITCIGDTDPGTSSYDVGPISCLRLTGYGEDLKIVGNTLQMYFTGPYSPNYSMDGPFGACIMFDEFQMELPNIVIDSNLMESDNLCIRWGFFNGQGGNVTLRDNIYRYLNNAGDYVFFLGYGAGGSRHAYGNVDRDGVFQGGAQATDILVDDNESDSLSISLEATLSVTVMGNNGQTVSGANVSVVNGYGDQVASGISDAYGRFTSPVRFWYEANDTFSGGDSTNYNDFTIEVSKGGDNSSLVYAVGPTSKNPTVTLENTAGDTGTDDSTPPASILDLGAACEGQDGDVQLTWTATGDDGTTGQASAYDLRYSESPINSGNFAAAAAVTGLPAPGPSGYQESFLFGLPNPTETYYFAIRAYDDAGLASPLASPVEYSAGNIRAPTIDTVYVDTDNRLVTLIVKTAQACLETHHEFQIDDASGFTSPESGIDSSSETYASYTFGRLLDNTVYYWRCRARTPDGGSVSDWSPVQGFMPFVTFATGCDDFALYSPADGSTVESSGELVLTVENANSELQNVYFFQFSDNAEFIAPLASAAVSQQPDGFTSWTVPVALTPGSAYYWRVQLNNCSFTDPFTLVASPGAVESPVEPFAYPNPCNPSAGDPLTFSSIPASCQLALMTVSGELVHHWSDTDGSDILWYGDNFNGAPVASGIYVWTINPGGQGGKIIVVR